MTLADVDPATAQAAVEEAAARDFASPDDDVILHYLQVRQTVIHCMMISFLATEANTSLPRIMDNLNANNDPRKISSSTTNNDGEYVGGVVGKVNPLSDYSPPSDKVSDANAPYAVLDYSEIEFLRAEAIERGFSVTGTAAEHYEYAIKAIYCLLVVVHDAAELMHSCCRCYLAQATVAYATATGDWKEKIGTQKWLAFYNRAYESWLEFRRLDYPAFSLAQDRHLRLSQQVNLIPQMNNR